AETQAAAAASVAPAAEPEAPAPEPVMAAEIPAEPSFFGAADQEEAEEAQTADDFFGTRRASDDDLPPPAYRPAPVQPQLAAAEPPQTAFAASRPAGTPAPEVVARLRAAVQKTGESAAAPAAPTRPVAADSARFGIGSLINRMTGTAADAPVERPAAAGPRPVPQAVPEEDRIEVPAFLRRQAN
ncbi:MAG: cell division protein FtsZ, partial [Pseudomonadota bacterium]